MTARRDGALQRVVVGHGHLHRADAGGRRVPARRRPTPAGGGPPPPCGRWWPCTASSASTAVVGPAAFGYPELTFAPLAPAPVAAPARSPQVNGKLVLAFGDSLTFGTGTTALYLGGDAAV